MGLIGCPETSVRSYHYSLHNNPEVCSSHLLHGGSLISRLFEQLCGQMCGLKFSGLWCWVTEWFLIFNRLCCLGHQVSKNLKGNSLSVALPSLKWRPHDPMKCGETMPTRFWKILSLFSYTCNCLFHTLAAVLCIWTLEIDFNDTRVMFWQGYFDALRIEKMARNITVTLLCPGPVFTNFLADSFTGKTGEVSWQYWPS